MRHAGNRAAVRRVGLAAERPAPKFYHRQSDRILLGKQRSLGGRLLRAGKRQARLRRERKNINSAVVYKALFYALHDNKRLHHWLPKAVSECAFLALACEDIATLWRNKLFQVLLEYVYFNRGVAA